jgi:hypothetical protein
VSGSCLVNVRGQFRKYKLHTLEVPTYRKATFVLDKSELKFTRKLDTHFPDK